MEDFKIIDLYWQRDERAISQTAEKYEVYLKSISYNLLHVAEDVQECVNDTYLTAWNSMPPKRPAVLKTWLGRVVRNLSLKKWNHDHALKRYNGIDVIFEELSECIPSEDTVEKPQEVKRPILDAIRNRKLYFVTDLPVSELESAGSLEALVDEIIDIVNYDINGYILASSDGGGMLIGYCAHAETDEVKDTVSLYITFVYNYDPWKSLDSSISDPGEMLAKTQTSMDFRQWKNVFAFMPVYQADEATELVSSIIDNGRYYGYFDMYPDSVITGSCEFYESEMRWFIENVFHVDPEAYKTGLDQYLSKYPERYNNGIIYGMVAGAPVNEVTTVIDEVEYDGKYWHMKGHDHYLYDNTDMLDHSFLAVMEISQTETGQLYWSIYSFARDK